MACDLLQVAYTPEAWATMIRNPQDRAEAVRPVIERLGGSVHSAFMAFGEYDSVLIVQMPDNVSAAALAVIFSAGGAGKAVKTTPLITVEESLEMMRKAGTAGYRPPTS